MQSAQALRGSNLFLLFLGGLIALTPLSIDAYLPAMPAMANYFSVNIVAVNLTMTFYLLGGALGQFFGGALSDHLGRRRVGQAGLLVFMIATLLITGATTIEQVWALRALQAVGGGASSVVCMAQVRDIYPPSEVGNKIANVMMVMLVAPLIAPLLGALLMPWGWKSIFYFLALYASVYFTIYCFYIPETNADERRRVTFRSMTASYKAVLAHRVDGRRKAQRLMCFSACSAGIFMSYLTNAAFIYMQHFGLNEFEFSAAFATAGLAMMVGNRSAAKLMSVYSPAKVLSWANGCHIVAIAAAVVWLLLFGSNLWATMLIMMVIVAISGAVGPSAAGLYISLFHENVGSAASLNSTFMFMFGALFGALSALVAGGSLTPIFLAMLVAAILARIALPREV